MVAHRNRSADVVAMGGYKLASALARLAPTSLIPSASVVVGKSLAMTMSENRAMIALHMKRINPQVSGKELQKTIGESFSSYVRYYAETFRLASLTKSQIEHGHTVEGFEHIVQAATLGKGTILALPHMGGWEWSGRWLVEQGYGLTAVVERLENPEIFNWFLRLRKKCGFNIIGLDDQAGILVSKALRENQIVSLLCDRDIPKNGVRTGVEVEFFGERTTVPSGPAFFALRTGAPLLPMATFFSGSSDGHCAIVRPPIVVQREGSLRQDVARISQMLSTEIETLIRRAPAQWHLFGPNWPSDPGY